MQGLPHEILTTGFRDWLNGLEDGVLRLSEPISTVHEITALQHELDARGRYPVIVAEKPVLPDGEVAEIPVVTNVNASRVRTAAAVGLNDHRRAAAWFAGRTAAGFPPVTASPDTAPAREVVLQGNAVDLTRLPALTQHDHDPGPYLTAARATTVDPETGIDNTAIQRCWIKGPRRMSWFPYPASHNMANLKKFWARGEPCPVAFWIGHHPAVMMGAQAKLAYPESHWTVAGGLAGGPIRLVETVTHGDTILVPADAEIVIEGYAPPNVLEADGPFGEYTGYAGPQVAAPVCEVSAITRRRDALWHDYGSGLADALVPDNLVNEGVLFTAAKAAAQSVCNVHVPVSGRRFHAWLQLDQPRPGDVQAALAAVIANRRVKTAIAVDRDIDLFDPEAVLWAVATRVQWHRDSRVIEGEPGSLLDPSLDFDVPTTSKITIDATLPPAEAAAGAPRPVPPRLAVPAAAREKARQLLAGVDIRSWPEV